MTISIVKGSEAIVALIGSISTKQADYRDGVTSTVLSAVAHSIEHSECTTVDKLLNEVFNVAYRDLKVVAKFIQSVTPIILEEVKDGRRTRFVVKACQFEKNNFDREGKTQKEISELSVKALKRHNSRAELFANFCKPDGTMKVRNMEWKEGDDKSTKTVDVAYGCDIFKWYEDVEYIRKEVENGKDENSIDPFELLARDEYENAQNPIVSAIKALSKAAESERSPEIKADLETLEAIANRIAEHVKARAKERQIAFELATFEKLGASQKALKDWPAKRDAMADDDAIKAAFENQVKIYKAKRNKAAAEEKSGEDKKAA